MERDSQTTEIISSSPIQSNNKTDSIHGTFENALDFGTSLWNRCKHLWAFICAFLYTHALMPTTVFLLGIYTAIEKKYNEQKLSIMCICHECTVKIMRIKARRATGIIMLTGLVFVLFSTSFYSLGLEVIIDGKTVGYVLNEADYMSSVNQVQDRVSEIMGRPYSVNPRVNFSFSVVQRDKILKGPKLESLLFSQIEDISELYVLSIDGKMVGASQNKDSVERILNELVSTKNPNVRKEFNSKIAISHEIVDSKFLMTEDEMRKLLTSKKVIQDRHIIQPGDTFESIMRKYNMKRSDLIALNPGVDPDWIIDGRELLVNKSVPFLSIKQTQRVTERRSLPFEVKEMKDPNLYVGKKSIKVSGVAGSQVVVSDVSYINGEESGRKVINTTVIKNPITEVIMVGSKPVPTKAATGIFRRPTGACIMSSNYGYRHSEFHTGVDFALSYGSPVVAADGGTVSFAGWKGGYGKLIIISHGNGLQTYYGHNSSLLVSTGQKVAKGEQIARIGSTGRSTGPHCHFEVRLNGRHVNPWRYID